MSAPARRAVVVAAAAAAGLALSAAPAVAAPPAVLHAVYDAAGTSTIVKPGAVVPLGPTTFTADLAADGTFTGSLALPSTNTSFKVLGLLPVTSTVNFIPVGAVTGALKLVANRPAVTATAKYTIQLTNVKVAGLPAFVGSRCTTTAPVTIPIATPAGQVFDIGAGGTVAGTYTIGNFGHCGLATGLLNLLVPGPNNTVSFTLSNGRLTQV